MIKFSIFAIFITCFCAYGIWPILTATIVMMLGEEKLVGVIGLAIYSVTALIQLMSMIMVFKRRKKAAFVFFAAIFVPVLFRLSDIALEASDGGTGVSWNGVTETLLFPLLAVGVIFMSDAKYYFEPKMED
ncbi:hypothetical protein [Marinomonas mediterranea]|uniref:hypothetical protein n=1 Tax=Marinomonas mediterranea TaxID=119864 RepID=UPI002349EDF8|nr:hypothetical protein [Marinomonas mediterranea]WCN10733.1 hypothetical protein GV055_18280 [Marinomonas mediterranea]WCN14789.1 hypothetical protein GV054_18150 [Marinomonas mediterranea]